MYAITVVTVALGKPSNIKLDDEQCEEGYGIPHHSDCGAYFECVNGDFVERFCQDDLHFNVELQVCDYPNNHVCHIENPSTRPPTVQTEEPSLISECPSTSTGYNVYLPHPNCSLFYLCSDGIPFEIACPENQHWNQANSYCDYPSEANCIPDAAPEQPGAILLPTEKPEVL